MSDSFEHQHQKEKMKKLGDRLENVSNVLNVDKMQKLKNLGLEFSKSFDELKVNSTYVNYKHAKEILMTYKSIYMDVFPSEENDLINQFDVVDKLLDDFKLEFENPINPLVTFPSMQWYHPPSNDQFDPYCTQTYQGIHRTPQISYLNSNNYLEQIEPHSWNNAQNYPLNNPQSHPWNAHPPR
jgi:hypothetical protein